MSLKCIGCMKMETQEMEGVGKFYYCERWPYPCPINGVMNPGEGVSQAAKSCPEDPLSSCVICRSTDIIRYGGDIVSICPYHDGEWGRWLVKHPMRYVYMSPGGKAVRENWVEVFREFVDDMKLAISSRRSG